MMLNLTQALREQIVQRVCAVTTPVKIFLFGSYAYGKPNENSDLDIAVICGQVLSKTKESLKIRKALKGIAGAKDIVVASADDFAFYCNEPGSVFKTISEKGVVLYAR